MLDDFIGDVDDTGKDPNNSVGQSSPSRGGSPSPMKRNLSPALKMGGRDLNSTGMALRSIGDSSEGRQAYTPGKNLTFKEPGAGLTRTAAKSQLKTTGPTASNLLKLDAQSVGSRKGILKSDVGKSNMDAKSNRSRKSDKEP